jgi:hypothetical protein
MDAHLNILEAVIITLDNELDVIKYWQGLLCHADFHHACVMAMQYNKSKFCWE